MQSAYDVIEQLGRVLDLVEDHRRTQLIEKCARIASYSRLGIRIFEQNVSGRLKRMTEEGRLAARRGTVTTTAGKCGAAFFRTLVSFRGVDV